MSNKTKSLNFPMNSNLNSLPVEIKLKLLKYLKTQDLRTITRLVNNYSLV